MRNVVMRDGADDVQYQKGTKRRWTALGEEEQWLQFGVCHVQSSGWGAARRGLQGVAGFSGQVKRRVWIPGNVESAPSWV